MFTLTSDIKIGKNTFPGIHEVVVKRSVNDVAATAVVKLPVTAVLHTSGKAPAQIEVAKAIRVGDAVRIRLGYDGDMRDEFIGYVKRLNLKTPLEVECEDAFYLARGRNVTLSGTKTLETVLAECGLNVARAESLTLKNFVVAAKSVAWVLMKLKKDYGLSVYFDFDGRVYAVRHGSVIGDTVRYLMRHNVVNDDKLQYMRKDDMKIYIKAVAFQKDGTKVEAKKGDESGTAKTLYFYGVTDMSELATLAQIELDRYSFDGYQGQITTFLQPFAAPGMVAQVRDNVYGQRSGTYFIESVETSFGMSGARRKVELGVKIQGYGQ